MLNYFTVHVYFSETLDFLVVSLNFFEVKLDDRCNCNDNQALSSQFQVKF